MQQLNISIMRLLSICLVSSYLLIWTPLTSAAQQNSPIQLEAGKHIIMIRHAIAPGYGDPNNFDVNDCSTQRNLSDAGVKQAQRIGKKLKGWFNNYRLYSSQWCRCLDTARHLDLGEINEQPLLNSFFRYGDSNGEQTQALEDWLKTTDWRSVPVLVTHQVNITDLTGVFPSSGEIIVLSKTPSGLTVVARQTTD